MWSVQEQSIVEVTGGVLSDYTSVYYTGRRRGEIWVSVVVSLFYFFRVMKNKKIGTSFFVRESVYSELFDYETKR